MNIKFSFTNISRIFYFCTIEEQRNVLLHIFKINCFDNDEFSDGEDAFEVSALPKTVTMVKCNANQRVCKDADESFTLRTISENIISKKYFLFTIIIRSGYD